MKVLVTGAGALLGQGIIKALRKAVSPYEIVAVDPDPRSSGLYWADRAYLVPRAADLAYIGRLKEIINREHPAAILIGTDVELEVFALHRTEIESESETKVIVSPPEVIRIADDKWLTYQFLAHNGFPHPRSAIASGLDDLLRECDFPLIVKPRIGARSMGVYRVTKEVELQEALRRVHNPIIQECIGTPDDEYTSGLIISQGHCCAVVTMRRDLRDGNTYRAYVEPDFRFDAFLAQLGERLGGVGPINCQFRVDSDGPKIFEINARFSGTTPLRTYAGYNEVDYVVRHFVLGEPIPRPAPNPVIFLRYWDEITIDPQQLQTLAQAGSLDKPRFMRPTSL